MRVLWRAKPSSARHPHHLGSVQAARGGVLASIAVSNGVGRETRGAPSPIQEEVV